jgi:hypothetical protein
MVTALDGLSRVQEAVCSAEQAMKVATLALEPDHPNTIDYFVDHLLLTIFVLYSSLAPSV